MTQTMIAKVLHAWEQKKKKKKQYIAYVSPEAITRWATFV